MSDRNKVSKLVAVSSTSLAVAGPVYLLSVVLGAGSATGSVLIQDTAAGGGTNILGLTTLTSGTGASWTSGAEMGVYFANGIYCTLAGTGVVAYIEYTV